MAKKEKTASATRKHIHQSFRQKVNAIKIDPIKDLTRRAYQDTEVSFFIATLKHWCEVNLSKTFTELVDKVEPVSQSLPQIIYHAPQIFDAIEETVKLNDPLSLQPTLELLAQFCHDLGSDFLPYYQRTLQMIVEAASKQDDPEALEQIFTALAYVFKYLSKPLSKDLLLTFKEIEPLTTIEKKEYITRFTSESMSFLVRKASPETLQKFISYAFERLNVVGLTSYHNALVTIFSEACKGPSENLHSKTSTILSEVASTALQTPVGESVLSDTVLEVIAHAGSPEKAKPVYDTLSETIHAFLKSTHDYKQLASITQLSTTLVFADSGRKISSWPQMLELPKKIVTTEASGEKDNFGDSLSQFVSILIRNAPGQLLPKYHISLFGSMSTAADGSYFLPFIELATEMALQKTTTYYAEFIRQFIGHNWKDHDSQIGYFLLRAKQKNLPLNVTIPNDFKNSIVKSHDVTTWQLSVLDSTATQVSLEWITNLLHEYENSDRLYMGSMALRIIAQQESLNDNQLYDILQVVCDKFDANISIAPFLPSFCFLLNCVEKNSKSAALIAKHRDSLILSLCKNLTKPDHNLRELTLSAIISTYDVSGTPAPETIMQCRVIEQVPLTMANSRDIPMRYRALVKTFETEEPSYLLNEEIASFLMGQMTVKFSPTWNAVLDFISATKDRYTEQLWAVAFEAISDDYSEEESDFMDTEAIPRSDLEPWYPSNSKLLESIENGEKVMQKYQTPSESITEVIETECHQVKPTSFSRYQAIKLLAKEPEIAEKHFESLYPFVMNEGGDGWTWKDWTSLVDVLSQFKHLDKVYGIDDIKMMLFRLLMDRRPEIQTLALNALLNLHNTTYDKYKTSLESLLSNTLFHDELSQLFQKDNENTISHGDADELMPLVIRILFGRALTQGSGTKQVRKGAAIRAINNMSPQHIKQFMSLSFSRIDYKDFIETDKLTPPTTGDIRNINGFLAMATEVANTLGKRHVECVPVLVEPLIYGITASEYVIEHPEDYDEVFDKRARNNRKIGTKLLYTLMDRTEGEMDWQQYGDLIYEHVARPRMPNFAEENLTGGSYLLLLMTKLWPRNDLQFFLYYDDSIPVKSLLEILPNPHAKDTVILSVLQFVDALLQSTNHEERFTALLTDVIYSCLHTLITVLEKSTDSTVNSLAVKILLSFAENGYINDNDSRKLLIASLLTALEKPRSQLSFEARKSTIKIMALLVQDYDCTIEDIVPFYKRISQLYETSDDINVRKMVTSIFQDLAGKFPDELTRAGSLVTELNAYGERKWNVPDFNRRLIAFQRINQEDYKVLEPLEWLPIVHTALFSINDEQEQSLRSSSSYTLCRFVDAYSSKEDPTEYVNMMEKIIVPKLKRGMRSKDEGVRIEYVKLLAHVVGHSKHYTDLEDMKVLEHGNDPDEDFFQNVLDLQVGRRQLAISELGETIDGVSSNSIAHYLLPLIEHYVQFTDGKHANLATETLRTITKITAHLTWNQYKAIFARYVRTSQEAFGKKQVTKLRDTVRVVVALSHTLFNWSKDPSTVPQDFPSQEELNFWVLEEAIPKLKKLFKERDDNTIIQRVPLSEAMVLLTVCCDHDKIGGELPAILSGISTALRSRFDDLRDTVRKHLGRIAIVLGPEYLQFIFKELYSALRRGPQVHILSYTIHSLLLTMRDQIHQGDLTDSASIIMDSIMNDLFGESANEKEADGYKMRMKEIRQNKSYDTGELIARNLHLKDFSYMLTPVKYLLKERLSLRTEKKLDQLLQQFSSGMVYNTEADSPDMLVLCYDLFNDAAEFVKANAKVADKPIDQKEQHFLVQLDAKPHKTMKEYSMYVRKMEKFSLQLLHTLVRKHDDLFKVNYMEKFVPLLVTALDSDDEGVIVYGLKMLSLLVKMEFAPETDAYFGTAAKKVLDILQDTPNMTGDLAQTGLKFLGTLIRYRDDLQLKDTSMSYLLKKIEPDLDERDRQSVAFNFIKSLVNGHYMLPELYDTMDVVARLMVTSSSNEIRNSARAVFYTFLMEYDQSKGRIDKQFKQLISNLKYPSPAGRESVLELINSIVKRSDQRLLDKLSSSFFVALANVAITDDSTTCRKMASAILVEMLKRMKGSGCDLTVVDKYTRSWMSQTKNILLLRCGLNAYSAHLEALGYEYSPEMNSIGLDRIREILKQAKRNDEETSKVNWQTVYQALDTWEAMVDSSEEMYNAKYIGIWEYVTDALLYPHSWVRQIATSLERKQLKNNMGSLNDEQLQHVAYRSFRELGAPNVGQEIANGVAQNLALASKRWIDNTAPYMEDGAVSDKYPTAIAWAMNRTIGLLRNESRPGRETFVAKKACISYIGFLAVSFEEEELATIIDTNVMTTLINLSEQDVIREDDQEKSLPYTAKRCLELLEQNLGVSTYNMLYTEAQEEITEKREERRVKEEEMELLNPEAVARRRMKKHSKSRDKRRERDHDHGGSGLYHVKRRKQ